MLFVITPDAALTPQNMVTVGIIAAVFLACVLVVMVLPSHDDELDTETRRAIGFECKPVPCAPEQEVNPAYERAVIFDEPIPVNRLFRSMGLQAIYDYADDVLGFDGRLSRCYELAGKACFEQDFGDLPYPVALWHGEWSGPYKDDKIGHAIVLLSDGRVWEPITAGLYDMVQFFETTKFDISKGYSVDGARGQMLLNGHFGPWH